MNIKDCADMNSAFEALKDTMDDYCHEAGLDSDMRVYTINNGMYCINAERLLRSICECQGFGDDITLITGTDPEGREYPVSIPFGDISLILDVNNKIAYETDDDYWDRAELRKERPD